MLVGVNNMVVVAVVEALTRAFIHDGGDCVGGGILVTRRRC